MKTQILFTGGLVFDGKGELSEDTAVLVENDRIVDVASKAAFEGFSGEVVYTNGATLMPGLTDTHVHLCYSGTADPSAALAKLSPGEITLTALENAQRSLRRGITSLRDCGGKEYLEFPVRDAINKGRFQGPTIHLSGRMICMTGGHGSRWGRIADGCDEVVKAVREQVHAGCDFVKIMATGGVMTPGVQPKDAHYTAEEMACAIQEAHRLHKRTATHAQGTEGILNAVRGGITSVEHGVYVDDTCIQEMLEAGTYLVPTISALRNMVDNADKGVPSYMVEKAQKVEQQQRESLLDFYRAGGLLAMGTDAGTPFNLHGANAWELKLLVDYGIAEKDALKAGCFAGADLMGLSEQGHISKGAVADLLLVKGNPLQDITMAADYRNHLAVYKKGQLVQ